MGEKEMDLKEEGKSLNFPSVLESFNEGSDDELPLLSTMQIQTEFKTDDLEEELKCILGQQT